MQLKKILVPFDFSALAENALHYAHWLASQTGASLIISHVVEEEQIKALQKLTLDEPSKARAYEEQFIETLQAHLEKASKQYQVEEVDILPRIESGELVDTLLRQITEQAIDLVVMATHAQSTFFEDTHTEQILRQVSIPILTIFTPCTPTPIKKIVLAIDTELSPMDIYIQVKAFQEFFKAELFLLHVVTPSHFYSSSEVAKIAERLIVDANLSNYRLETISAYREEEGILYFAQDIKADLIIMTTHQRVGIARLISGSITEEVIKQANIPVLSFGTKYIQI